MWEPTESDLANYARDGFIVVRRLLSEGEVHDYQNAIDIAIGTIMPRGELTDPFQRVFIQMHQVWQTEPALRSLSLSDGIARAASQLMGTRPVRLFLDQVIYKQPGALPTAAHQDAPFLSFDDVRSVNCWIAFDKTTEQNGALEYYRGSHALGRLRLVELDRSASLADEVEELQSFPLEKAFAEPGDAVFHNCLVVHQAFGNSTNRPRRAFSIQYMPLEAHFNGWMHPFMQTFEPRIGDVLALPCFPILAA